jgi:hypothetical protein
MLENFINRNTDVAAEQDADIKTEVVAAYHELLHKLKNNKQSQHHHMEVIGEEGDEELQHVTEERSIRENSSVEQEKFIEAVIRETPTECARNIDSLKHVLNDALEDVKEKYLGEQRKLIAIIDAIETKTRKISEIYDIEVNLDTLSALVMAQKEKTRIFDQEMQERRQQLDQEIIQRRREMQQEEQKYVYQRDLTREKERNRYEMAKRDLEQELTVLRQQTYKEFEEREARIASNEALNEKIEQFPDELRAAVQKAKEATTKQLTVTFEYENQLAQKEIKLCEQKIATLEAKISMLETNITHFESLKNSFNHLLFNKAEAEA